MSDTDILASAVLEIVKAVRGYVPPSSHVRTQDFINRVIAATDNPTINPVIARLEGRSDA